MYRGKVILAIPAAAVLEIQFQIGGVKGILDDFVEMDVAAIGDEGRKGSVLHKPGHVFLLSVDVRSCDWL